jgi:hypothetical protein
MKWKLVPVKPTDKMCEAGEGFNIRCGCANCDHTVHQCVAAGYKNMLDATPDDPSNDEELVEKVSRALAAAPDDPFNEFPISVNEHKCQSDYRYMARTAIRATEGESQ